MKFTAPQFSLLTLMLFAACVQTWLIVAKVVMDHWNDVEAIWSNVAGVMYR